MAAHLKTGVEQMLETLNNPDGNWEAFYSSVKAATEFDCFSADDYKTAPYGYSLWDIMYKYVNSEFTILEFKLALEEALPRIIEEWWMLGKPSTREEWFQSSQQETFFIAPKQIDKIFAEAEHQTAYVIGLYELVYNGYNDYRPNFDDIEVLNDYPRINDNTARYISQKAVDFDSIHHKERNPHTGCSTLPGGLWMNNGFGTDNDLEDWQCKPCTATMKEG